MDKRRGRLHSRQSVPDLHEPVHLQRALIQGRPIGDGSRRSPVTVVLKQAYVELVNYAWLAQYLKRLSE